MSSSIQTSIDYNADVDVSPIDPRTDPRWESPPTHDYRVVFWDGLRAHENDATDAQDVLEVIEWVEDEAKRRGASYTLWAKVDRGDDHGLVWLAGRDPTVHARPNFEREHPNDSG